MLRHGTRINIWSTGAKSKGGGRPPDLVKQEKVRMLFKEGFSDAEIAAVVGSTPGAVRNMRQKLGLQRKTRDRSRTYADKTCPVCGKTFLPFSGRHVYCGPVCRQKAGGAVG